MAVWQKCIEEALGINPPLHKRVFQLAKQTHKKYKKFVSTSVSVFVIKYILNEIIIFIEGHKAGAVIATVVLLLFMISQYGNEDQPKFTPSLFETVWKNDVPLQCGYFPYLDGRRIYASGKQNERNLRINTFLDYPVGQRYYIIKSDVVYWWDVTYTSKNQGYKRYIDEIAIEKFLNAYQKDYSSGSLICEAWSVSNANLANLFELPSQVNFTNWSDLNGLARKQYR